MYATFEHLPVWQDCISQPRSAVKSQSQRRNWKKCQYLIKNCQPCRWFCWCQGSTLSARIAALTLYYNSSVWTFRDRPHRLLMDLADVVTSRRFQYNLGTLKAAASLSFLWDEASRGDHWKCRLFVKRDMPSNWQRNSWIRRAIYIAALEDLLANQAYHQAMKIDEFMLIESGYWTRESRWAKVKSKKAPLNGRNETKNILERRAQEEASRRSWKKWSKRSWSWRTQSEVEKQETEEDDSTYERGNRIFEDESSESG